MATQFAHTHIPVRHFVIFRLPVSHEAAEGVLDGWIEQGWAWPVLDLQGTERKAGGHFERRRDLRVKGSGVVSSAQD